jgi:two-component system, sensor histidine kinase and response regulator
MSCPLNGKQSFFESRITPLDNERLLTVVQDITKNRQMQLALKEELDYREFLFDTDREGIVIVNNDHRIIDVNKKFCEMLGYSHEEMLNFHTWDFDAVMSHEHILEGFDVSVDVDERFESIHRRKMEAPTTWK